MKKLVIRFGLIGGLIVSLFMLSSIWYMMRDGGSPNFEMSETLGYVSMIVSLSVIFFGIKNYRDNYLEGSISFGKAFKMGLWITLIASLIYVVCWMIYYSASDQAQEFPAMYMEHTLEKLKEANTPQAEIETQMADMEKMFEIYENPIARAGITLMEIFPVGLIITLISSLILKRKE